jgi:hypothetical protein
MQSQKLQRHLEVELEILGLPRIAHSASADVSQDLAAADGCPDQDVSNLPLGGRSSDN